MKQGASVNRNENEKIVDKSKRAFSVSIDSSKAFEIAIRKPRKKLKHYLTRVRATIYSNYIFFVKQQGSPAESEDLTFYFVLYAAIVSIDIMLLLTMGLHCSYPEENFFKFGWAFWLMPPFVAVLSPFFAISAALHGSATQLKIVGSLNQAMVLVTIPLTLYLAHFKHDDPMYEVLLLVILVLKVAFSAISAKLVHILNNPLFAANHKKLQVMLRVQKRRMIKREETLGRDTARDMSGTGLFSDNNPMTYSSEDEARMRQSLLSEEDVLEEAVLL